MTLLGVILTVAAFAVMLAGLGFFVYCVTVFAVKEMVEAGASEEEIKAAFAESMSRFSQEGW